nr:MAG TPA: hypothetical protein [Caudoviricetes sp.]
MLFLYLYNRKQLYHILPLFFISCICNENIPRVMFYHFIPLKSLVLTIS